MTKFLTIDSVKSGGKRTVFTKALGSRFEIGDALTSPEDYDNILFIGHDKMYGDVFKAWDDTDPENFELLFGTKGDEFNS